MDALEGSEVNLIITSPPYNFNVGYEGYNDNQPPDDYATFLREAFSECARVLAPDGRLAVVLGLGAGRPLNDVPALVRECAVDIGFSQRDRFIWDKGESKSSSAWGS